MKIYSFLILILLSLASCKDILKEEPKAIAVSTYYNTADEILAGVNAIYPPYQTGLYFVLYPLQIESYSDLLIPRGSYIQNFDILSSTNITRVSGIWQNLYQSIRNANIVIANAPNAKNASTQDILKFLSEAKFMRALGYFHLVRSWGGVPIRTEKNMLETNVPRSTVDEVYQLIIDDLKDAEINLPDVPSQVGRPSKWAAKTLMADVYFYRGLNTEASAKAKEVIQSGKYSLIEVTKWEEFDSKLYGIDVIGSKESIFSIMFSQSGTDVQSSWCWELVHAKSPYDGGKGDYVVRIDTLMNNWFNKWDKKDIRKDMWFWWDCGFGTGTYLSRKFINLNYAGGLTGHDFPLYRYADLLLIYAEASCRANNGPTADGLEALNQVHRRAYGKNPVTQVSDVDFKLTDYNANSFNDLVIKERGYETIVESKRWFDLKRSGKVKEYIKASRGFNVSDNFLLWPIPNVELDYNKALDPTKDQNPGY